MKTSPRSRIRCVGQLIRCVKKERERRNTICKLHVRLCYTSYSKLSVSPRAHGYLTIDLLSPPSPLDSYHRSLTSAPAEFLLYFSATQKRRLRKNMLRNYGAAFARALREILCYYVKGEIEIESQIIYDLPRATEPYVTRLAR